ncbi:hypothetical protein [Streptosporangium vulgare]|uniref:Glycosyltransferase family 28 N-terminal domain-containing protein n=1 Tax=Streptosporangium vulgare TaxID=46190 RepID=A0ABV5TLA3_9ACTN
MKILILTHGIRGDVQPYAALALALQQPGYHAVPAAPAASAGSHSGAEEWLSAWTAVSRSDVKGPGGQSPLK